MKIAFKNLLFVLMLVWIVSGCSKTSPTVDPVVPPIIIVDPVTPSPTSQSKLIPVKFESERLIITLKYIGNTALLSSIDDNHGNRKILKYDKENLINGYEAYENDQLVYLIDYWRDADQKINKVSQFKLKGNILVPSGYYMLIYNNTNQLTSINTYSTGKQLLHTKTLTYDAALNMISVSVDEGTEEKSTFIYDSKNGICKYVPNAQLISLETQNKFFGSIVNNMLSKVGVSPAGDYSFSYDYNADSFPKQITLTESNVKTIFKVTYKTL